MYKEIKARSNEVMWIRISWWRMEEKTVNEKTKSLFEGEIIDLSIAQNCIIY